MVSIHYNIEKALELIFRRYLAIVYIAQAPSPSPTRTQVKIGGLYEAVSIIRNNQTHVWSPLFCESLSVLRDRKEVFLNPRVIWEIQ